MLRLLDSGSVADGLQSFVRHAVRREGWSKGNLTGDRFEPFGSLRPAPAPGPDSSVSETSQGAGSSRRPRPASYSICRSTTKDYMAVNTNPVTHVSHVNPVPTERT